MDQNKIGTEGNTTENEPRSHRVFKWFGWTAVGVIFAIVYSLFIGHPIVEIGRLIATEQRAIRPQHSTDPMAGVAKKSPVPQPPDHLKLADSALDAGEFQTVIREADLVLKDNPASSLALFDTTAACSLKHARDVRDQEPLDVDNIRRWHKDLLRLRELGKTTKYESSTVDMINNSIKSVEKYAKREGLDL